MQSDLLTASKRIKQAQQESKKLFNQLSDQSRTASASGSSTLFGMLGGFTGTGIAYAASFYTAATFVGLAPILAGAGIVIGVLAFRGKGRIKLESHIEVYKRALESIREEIRLLPKNAPEAVKAEAWETYRRLLSISPLIAEHEALPSPQQPAHPANALPHAATRPESQIHVRQGPQ